LSLVLFTLLAAGGVVAGRWLARSIRGAGVSAASVRTGEAPAAAGDSLVGLPCGLGDVVVRTAERDEAWLAGALVFSEDRAVAALFVAPEAGVDRAIFARNDGPELTWLSPLAPHDLGAITEPPHTLERAGVRYERARRLPVRVVRLGSGAPNVGDRAIIGEYVGPGAERAIVVAAGPQTVAWVGVALEEREYDVLPSGKATLDG
jgi:hypothetical protein